MSTPRIEAVSVVVCNYNGEAHLEHCLGALAKLDGPIDEVLLVDNESTDASVKLVEEKFPSIRIVHSGGNLGPACARNLGMREAKNRWVLAVDNDAVLEPNVLTRMIEAAESRPDVAIVQPRSVFATEPSRVHYDGGSFHYAGLISLRNFYVPRTEAIGEGICEVDCAVSVGLLVDRDLVLEMGGYFDGFFILFEDLDLSYRLRSAGKLILSVEDVLIHHRGGTAGISFREGKTYPRSRVFFHSRNRWFFLARCYRLRTLLVAAPGLLLYELAWFGFALLGGNLLGWLQGKWAFVCSLPQVLRDRKEIAARRQVRDRDLLIHGPLTTTPDVATQGAKRLILSGLDRLLSIWWKLARVLAA